MISVWNCYAVGIAWKDTMAFGGWFNKTLLWSGVIQSGVGFSMPIMLILGFGASFFLSSGENPMFTLEEADQILQGMFSLWYVLVIFPVLGSGLAIWAHSLREAYRRRDFGSIAVAGYNSFAQIHNMVSAANNLGGAFGNVGELFGKALDSKGGKGKDKLFILLIILVIVAIIAGFMIAFALVRHYASNTDSRIEEYGDQIERQRYANR
ncbi:MAG TPA: hypothetical protein P5230_00105 [Candidatus Magasanikbacteria bacterium]|nr:hypothetical protein [Candidatus Magasanikbacteria bacterium]